MIVNRSTCLPFVWAAILALTAAGCGQCPPCEDDAAIKSTSAKKEHAKDTEADDTAEKEMTATPIGSAPKEVKSFDLHGRAGFDRVSIWSKPDMESPRLGYLRMGQRMMVGNPEYSTESCPKGWFLLETGGYVCQGRGMLVGEKPRFIRNPPPPPRVDQLDPYPHGFIRADFTPAYKRLPAKEEIWQPPTRFVPGEYRVAIPLEDADETADGGTDAPAATRTVTITVDERGKLVLPDGLILKKDADGEPVLPPGVDIPKEDIPHVDPDAPKVEGEEDVVGIDYYKYARRNYRGISEFLLRGFWVSVAKRFRDEATREYYYQTIRGEYVPGNAVHLVKPPEFHGYRVLGDTPLPAAIVKDKYAAFYEKRNNRFRGVGPVDRLNVYRVYAEEQSGGQTYYQIEGDRWLKGSQVAFFRLREELPEGVGENDKWIWVDLSKQTLEAYQGAMPIFVTLVSTGLPESEETVTPNGEFAIDFKHVTDNMAGSVGDGEDVYSVADVPWVQYIHRNIAFHASFWHSKYGTPKSHGCINLSPADARYLFDWSGPTLPDGWHGVAATEDNPGTKVFIFGKTPK
ncbi:MAG: L,D-transpeptidase [Deltaproteobacteria bacterium]|nr:L,D-transpeptidase [Deltaproteobacteria bacterium]